jgi:hypothetical protein
MAVVQDTQAALALLQKQQVDNRKLDIKDAVLEIKTGNFFKQNWNDLL